MMDSLVYLLIIKILISILFSFMHNKLYLMVLARKFKKRRIHSLGAGCGGGVGVGGGGGLGVILITQIIQCFGLKQNEAQSARAESTHKGVN